MCGIDWSELRLWLSPAITSVGIFTSVIAAIFIPRHQKRLDRLSYANAAADALSEAMARIWDRLEIRLYPDSQERTGRKMRQFRSDGALATLRDFKVSELPIELVSTFGAVRTGLSALNEAMNGEEVWPPEESDINRYKVVYGEVKSAVGAFNTNSYVVGTRSVSVPPEVIR